MKIRCIATETMRAWECNRRLDEITIWLDMNCGQRWIDYDWEIYGWIDIYDKEISTMFKLKFGV